MNMFTETLFCVISFSHRILLISHQLAYTIKFDTAVNQREARSEMILSSSLNTFARLQYNSSNSKLKIASRNFDVNGAICITNDA